MKQLLSTLLFVLSFNISASPFLFGQPDLGHETFQLSDVDSIPNAQFDIVLEAAGFANTNRFGIYDTGGTNRIEIFNGANDTNSIAALQWDLNTNAVSLTRSDNNGITFTDFGVLGTIEHLSFGFYLESVQGIFFSENSLNAGGLDYLVVLQGLVADAWTLGFEDLLGLGDRDYNDFVVGISDVLPTSQQVPEPVPLLMLGLGLLYIGFQSKRRQV